MKTKAKYGYGPYDKLCSTGLILQELQRQGRTASLNLFEGYRLEFVRTENENFQKNLEFFGSSFPLLLADVLLQIAKNQCGSKVEQVVEYLEESNPLQVDLNKNAFFYRSQLGNFLLDVFVGLMPGKVWTGVSDVSGGCILVKKTGDLVYYDLAHPDQFQEYLIKNTFFEQASRWKHEFGFVYKHDTHLSFKLNLQIRFK